MAVALALVTVVALLARPHDGTTFPANISLVVIGLGMGWTGLASCYLAFGRQWVLLRIPLCTLIAVSGGAISALGERPDNADYGNWCGVLLFATFVVAVPLIYLWARGLRLTHPEHPPIEYWKPRSQFTLSKLFALITCAAVLLAVAVRLKFPIEAIYIVLMLCGTIAAVTYVGAATILSRIPLVWACLAIPIPVLITGVWLAESGLGTFSQMVIAPTSIAVIIVPWMLMLRIAGYYLHWPDYSAIETVGPSKRLVDEHGQPVELAQPLRLHQPPDGTERRQSNHSSEQSNLG